jgi:hypothetical protein
MQRKSGQWRALLPGALLLLAALACGGFQLRPTASSGSTGEAAGKPTATTRSGRTNPTPTSAAATVAPTIAPTITPTLAIDTGGLAVGQAVRVLAVGGINVRDKAGTTGKQVGKLSPNQVVTLKSGPVQSDNFTWWQVDTGSGLTGWVSSGPTNDPWLKTDQAPVVTPAAGGGKLVDRPIKVGDLVQVTTQEGRVLTVRDSANKDGAPVARVLPGTQFTVRAGPEKQSDLTWWQVEGDQVKGWAAEGDGTDRWLEPVER